MKSRRFSILAVGLLSFGALGWDGNAQSNLPAGPAPGGPAAVPPLEIKAAEMPDRQQVSLAFGAWFARQSTNYLSTSFGMDARSDLDMTKVVEGFSNYMANSPGGMPLDEVTNILTRQVSYLKEKVQQESNAMVAAGAEYKAKGVKFLEDNATAPGVMRLTNGVEYKVIKEGDGVMPGMNDLVTINMIVKLIDGTEVGSLHRQLTLSNLKPAPAALSQVVAKMKAGSHWVIFLPYDLAYGDKPAMGTVMHAPKVPPYSAVIFDLELEAVRSAAPGGPGAPAGMAAPNAIRPSVVHVPTPSAAQTSSNIVRVPSAEEMKKGSNIETMTLDEAIKRSQTNAPPSP